MSGSRYKGSVRPGIAAWLVTGPLGHLVAGAIDWGELILKYVGAQRARDRQGRTRA